MTDWTAVKLYAVFAGTFLALIWLYGKLGERNE